MVAALRLLPLILTIGIWELYVVMKPSMAFFLGRPSEIIRRTGEEMLNGALLFDIAVTATEAALGLAIGTAIGTVIGLSFWFSKSAFWLAKPYIMALGATPVFALAPVIVVWFGTGTASKVAIAAISTFFVALYQSYLGVSSVDPAHERVIRALGGNSRQVFRKVAVPTSLVWVIGALKLCVGFALLGAFLGEYISAERGLGHRILVASGLFDISGVWIGILGMMAIAIVATWAIDRSEMAFKRLIVRVF